MWLLAVSIFDGVDARQIIAWTVMVFAIVYLLYRSSQRIKGKGRVSPRAARQKAATNLSEHAEVRSNLERLLVDLEELARKINAGIDTRFCKLEVVIKQADERIKRLEQLTGGDGAEQGAESENPDPQKQIIYKLADTGKSAVEIAQELNQHPGEVELILSLRRSGPGGNTIDYTIDD